MSESGLIGGPVGPGGPSVAGQGAIIRVETIEVIRFRPLSYFVQQEQCHLLG